MSAAGEAKPSQGPEGRAPRDCRRPTLGVRTSGSSEEPER